MTNPNLGSTNSENLDLDAMVCLELAEFVLNLFNYDYELKYLFTIRFINKTKAHV